MHYGLTVSTAATAEPVTLDEAKGHLNVTDDADNPLIARMIRAAIKATLS